MGHADTELLGWNRLIPASRPLLLLCPLADMASSPSPPPVPPRFPTGPFRYSSRKPSLTPHFSQVRSSPLCSHSLSRCSFPPSPRGLSGQATEIRNIPAHCYLLSAQVLPSSSLNSPQHCTGSVLMSVWLCVHLLFTSLFPGFLGRLVHCLFHLSVFLSACFNLIHFHFNLI